METVISFTDHHAVWKKMLYSFESSVYILLMLIVYYFFLISVWWMLQLISTSLSLLLWCMAHFLKISLRKYVKMQYACSPKSLFHIT